MLTNSINIETTIIGSEDGNHTYAIKKTWDKTKKNGIIIELYPTISADELMMMDVSTLHLQNHVNEWELGSITIVNLYSQIYRSKPLASTLKDDNVNIKYIMSILESADVIIIAWGSSLSSNKKTIEKKLTLLKYIQDKKLGKQVKCIVPEEVEEDVIIGAHPLYLGLHYPRDKWNLKSFPVTNTVNELSKQLKEKQSKKKEKKNNKKEEENVPENNEQTGCE